MIFEYFGKDISLDVSDGYYCLATSPDGLTHLYCEPVKFKGNDWDKRKTGTQVTQSNHLSHCWGKSQKCYRVSNGKVQAIKHTEFNKHYEQRTSGKFS